LWGHIATDASYQLNFNTSFSSTRSDVLVHLAQWQYWWWFWFAFLWSFYYLVVARVVRYRTLKMRPKIMTSYRPHGKWGDFLAAIVPGLWCLNILTNSNFILRLIEWQNESSLFTVRIRARQWYWVYKFELKSFTDILSAPKNIGRNRWQVDVFGDLLISDDYLHVLQLRSQNRWVKNYWSSIFEKSGKSKKFHVIAPQEQLRLNFFKENIFNVNKNLLTIANNDLTANFVGSYKTSLKKFSLNDLLLNNFDYANQKKAVWENKVGGDSFTYLYPLNNFNFKKLKLLNKEILNQLDYSIFNKSIDANISTNMYSDFVETSRLVRRNQGISLPVRIIKNPLEFGSELFGLRFGDNESVLRHKVMPHTNYLVLKQKRKTGVKGIYPQLKRYKLTNNLMNERLNAFVNFDSNKNSDFLNNFSNKSVSSALVKASSKLTAKNRSFLFDTTIMKNFFGDATVLYDLIKKNKKRADLIPVTLARRIVRTKKTLVLPAHVNVTLITNSFDIVHSWFVPGLGIKIDCVPGRSTHHTFYIDNVGFYYGQCAEICGRYHHHMPIRVCALPFEHFLVWWHTFGMPKLIFTSSQRKFETYYSFRKFVW
jgi:hypothetical protein